MAEGRKRKYALIPLGVWVNDKLRAVSDYLLAAGDLRHRGEDAETLCVNMLREVDIVVCEQTDTNTYRAIDW